MQRLPDLTRFAKEHDLTLVSVADLIAYRRRSETQIERAAEARIPTGTANSEHLATAGRSTAASTLRSSAVTSVPARTFWYACIPSA